MNMHGVVSGAIQATNPFVLADIQLSLGYATALDGVRAAIYKPTIPDVPVQVQALQYRDLVQIEGLNLQGIRRKIYINRKIDGLVRVDNQGGDLITIKQGQLNGYIFLVAMVLEYWPEWTSVAATLQNEGPNL